MLNNGKTKCIDFVEDKCLMLKQFPYVCNKCSKHESCKKSKRYYDFHLAQEQHEILMSGSRSKPRLTNEEIKKVDDKVSKRILLKQSLFHIHSTDKELQKMCSEHTLRRLLYGEWLEDKKYNLPRFVRYAPKDKKKPYENKRSIANPEHLYDRSYRDYIKYRDEHASD